MEATDFTRDDCQVGNRRRTYNALKREWVCNGCGGRLVRKAGRVECGRCGSCDFIHEVEWERQACEAREVVAGLPINVRRMIGADGSGEQEERMPGKTLAYGRHALRGEPIET